MIFYYLCEFFKSKISIMSLINDLGINKVPKENKNKNNTFQIFGDYYFKLKNSILDMRIFKIVYELKST
jgi:hypothetical protein